MTCFGCFQAPTEETASNTVASGQERNYVIVGRGFAAVLNHTTLRQTAWGRDRIGDLTVKHIGFKDPWFGYRDHGMGQFPHFLVMPGYKGERARDASLHDVQRAEPLRSTNMAGDTQEEWDALRNQEVGPEGEEGGVYTRTAAQCLDGWVVVIQRKKDQNKENGTVMGSLETYRDKEVPQQDYKDLITAAVDELAEQRGWHGNAPYRLLVMPTPQGAQAVPPRWVYAHKIDICTGMGVINHRTKGPGQIVLAPDKESYLVPPWIDPDTHFNPGAPARVVPAQHALFANCWKATGGDKRICLMGGGGVSVNLCETLVADDTWMDWTTGSDYDTINLPDRLRTTFFVGGLAINVGALIPPANIVGINTNYDSDAPGGHTDAHGYKAAPYTQRLRFVYGVRLKEYNPLILVLKSGGTAKVTEFNVNPVLREILRDAQEEVVINYAHGFDVQGGALPALRTYHQVILNEGMQSIRAKPGTATFMTQGLGNFHPLKAYDNRLVGMRLGTSGFTILNPIGRFFGRLIGGGYNEPASDVRILGQAGMTYLSEGQGNDLEGAAAANDNLALSRDHNNTFPEQGRLNLNGITYCGLSIALANRYFDGKEGINRNINTATPDELVRAMIKPANGGADEPVDNARQIADRIVATREDTSEGFMVENDVGGMTQHGADADEVAAVQDCLNDGRLEYFYAVPPPDAPDADRQPALEGEDDDEHRRLLV